MLGAYIFLVAFMPCGVSLQTKAILSEFRELLPDYKASSQRKYYSSKHFLISL
jgi:hypothetical protein